MVVTIIAEESSFRFRSDAFRPSKRKSTVRTTRTATRTATRTTRKRQTRRTTKKKTSCTYDDRYDDEAESSSIDDEEERHAQSSGILHCQRLSPRRQQHFAWLSSYSTGIVPTMDHLSATHGYRRDDDDEEEEWKRYLGRRVQRNVIRCLPSNYSYFSEVPSETAKEEAKKEEERTEPTEATSTSSPTAEKEIPPPLQRNLKFRRVPLPPNDDAAADADEDLLADYARFVQSLGGGATNAKRARFRFPLNWGTHVPPLPGRDDPGVLISHAGAAEEEEEEAENGTEDEESEDAVVVPPERRSGYVLRVPYVFGTVVGASPPGGASDGGNCEADEFKFEFEFEFDLDGGGDVVEFVVVVIVVVVDDRGSHFDGVDDCHRPRLGERHRGRRRRLVLRQWH
mmetsp:Transcript_1601/g.3592  ORF Transcript_1601/g.3592 Transcript_1601/m.3592 type:complete len:398 (+) Transcript_1601:43-1236(+)